MDFTIFSHLNWLAIGVSALAYFALGAVWYSVLFGKAWIKATGIDMNRPDAQKGAGGIMIMTLLLEFIICFTLAILISRMYLQDGIRSGIKLGLLTGIGLCTMVMMISYLYQRKPMVLTWIDGTYHILGNMLAASIICAWH